jgi:hypothetical protein
MGKKWVRLKFLGVKNVCSVQSDAWRGDVVSFDPVIQ